jgi:putative transposase
MTNHFHFLIRIKTEKELRSVIPDLQGFENLEGLLSRQFGNFFNSYAKAYNKQQNRKGSLFMKTFKRIKVTNMDYLQKLVHYIHMNPVEAELCNSPGEWEYSSYATILKSSEEFLKTKEVLEWFDDKDNFIHIHRYPSKLTGID